MTPNHSVTRLAYLKLTTNIIYLANRVQKMLWKFTCRGNLLASLYSLFNSLTLICKSVRNYVMYLKGKTLDMV